MPAENEKPVQYAIRSTVRAVHNRTARAALPQKPRRKQYIGGELRLAHGRDLVVTEAFIEKHHKELLEKQAGHVLEVRTMDGRLVDLATGAVGAPRPAMRPPSFPVDSVNNDKNFPGLPSEVLARSNMGDDGTVPQVLQGDAKPALFKDAATHAENADDPDAKPGPVPVSDDAIDAAIEQAEAAASTEESEEPSAEPAEEPSAEAKDHVSSEKKGKRSRR